VPEASLNVLSPLGDGVADIRFTLDAVGNGVAMASGGSATVTLGSARHGLP
jgi:hypothetical protein